MNAPFLTIQLPISRQLSPGAKRSSIVSLNDGGYLLSFEDKPGVIRLDAHLKEVWSRDLQAQKTGYVSSHISANADGSLIAVAGCNDIRIFDAEGNVRWTFPHEPWNHFSGANCFFSADNTLLWIIAPGNPDQLCVVRTADFSILDHYTLEGSRENSYDFMATPDKEKVLIQIAAGQDDATLYLAQLIAGKIVVQELSACNDRIAGNFPPNGKEFATGPHEDEGIEIFAFPSFEKTGSLEQSNLFASATGFADSEDPDTLNYTVLFLNDTTLLAFTRFGRLLLVNRHTMTCVGELLTEGNDIKAYNEDGSVTTDSTAIIEYAGDIVTVQVNGQQLILTYGSGDIRWHDLSPLKGLAALT
jgi:hypothetical protein